MRVIGWRKDRPISFAASASMLAEGARFNDEIHQLPTGDTTYIPKGVFRFATLDAANLHQSECLALGMANQAMKGVK